MEAYAAKVKELETLFSDMDGGLKPANSAEIEAALRAAEDAVDDLQDDTTLLLELEKRLQTRLSSISSSQLSEVQDIQNIADKADVIQEQQQTYKTKVEEVQTLMEEMKRKLNEAKSTLRAAELPLGDAPLGANDLSSLVQTAEDLADQHETKANTVEKTANEALADSKKGLALVRTLMNRENKVKELIGDLKTMYDQTSARVKGLEDQATRLSGEAKDESKMAAGMLKDIASMERNIPSPMKGEMDAMFSRLDGVKKAVDDNISEFAGLQGNVQRNMAAAEDLLAEGKAAEKELGKLVDRVNTAKGITEGALQRINSNTNDLDNALNTLRGFDRQIDGSRTLADAAISRLPGINATIREAVDNNAKTLSALGDVSKDYDSALGSLNMLGDLVNNLEATTGSLPSHAGLANKATKLNGEVKDLKLKVEGTVGDLALELEDARRLEDDARKAVLDVDGAYNNARQTRDAIGKTVQTINNLLANINKPGAVDEEHLERLEDSLASAQKDVEGSLRPRLKDMEAKENAQRRRLTGINQDIDTILADIANLEDILKAIPKGCYNTPPIEEA